MRNKLFLITALILLAITGCRGPKPKAVEDEKRYDRPLPPGQLALRKITDPAQIPDFTVACYNTSNLRQAIASSLNYMSKPSSQGFFPYGHISHAKMTDSLEAFLDMIDSGLYGKDLARAVKQNFDVYTSVGCDNRGTVLFTGYYTPIFNGSLERTTTYQYPLYEQPDDLVKGENGEILGQRQPNGTITKYPSRAQIQASNMLTGNELIWLSDPFEAYIIHVQGSAAIRLPDGRLVNVGYAATNGHDYKSLAKKMVNENKIDSSKMSLSAMIDYFKQNKHEVNDYIAQNPRYVFFRFGESGPRGSLNEPVVPMRTIATDKSVYPRAGLAFLTSTLPQDYNGTIAHRRYSGFVLDQDTGGAIRAPGRCDIYIGQGDLAGQKAGQTYQEGRLYYLFLK